MKDWRFLCCWLWQAWRGNRLQAVLNAMLGLLGVALSLTSVWAMKYAIDVATSGGNWHMPVLFMATLILCEFAVSMLRIWVRNILGVKAQNLMQQRMLDTILHSRWQGRESMHSGDIVNRLVTDVGTVISFLTETLPNTLSTICMFVGAFFYLYTMDPGLAFITVFILPVFILLSRIYISRMRRYTREVRESDSVIQSTLTETVQNRTLIKTLQGEDTMLHRLADQQTTLRQQVRRRTIFSLLSNLTLNLGFSLGYLIAFVWCIVRLADHTLTYGGMSAFLQLVFRIQAPARDITKLAPAFVQVFTAAERLAALETSRVPAATPTAAARPSTPSAPIPASAATPASTARASAPAAPVSFTNVTFRYNDGERDILHDFTHTFPTGSTTAIMGETGAGKTTLLRLILGLIQPTSGTAVVPRLSDIVYVPQGNTLLSGTIRDNLLLASPSATEAEMRAALHTACADFVYELPDGLDTSCTENGGGLSEGQAQRICIARALLRHGSLYLFDEATSALDLETERQLLHNLIGTAAPSRPLTVIFVTHRTAVVDFCDEVVRL